MSDTAERVAVAFRSLAPEHQRALTETAVRNRSVEQAAETMGIPQSTLKLLVYHALKAFQRAYTRRTGGRIP